MIRVILILTLAGLSLACVGAMHNAPWSLFTVAITIPIAILMGVIMKKRTNSITLAMSMVKKLKRL